MGNWRAPFELVTLQDGELTANEIPMSAVAVAATALFARHTPTNQIAVAGTFILKKCMMITPVKTYLFYYKLKEKQY
ncbi:hypothetical protein B9Z44_14755 [Limnohabitans curvus]|uniref:Uncharacterized protein n=1 Tax=Limnohabitans curvus TaxID=323423 RepID=A0A315EF01_9BURK|nr:hypothetical protein B9Z44_14755 [Limnohabitans curvus]